jgi:DNA-binding transcriptional LysR family regulator
MQPLRGFLAVAKEGSFSAAARKTFRTQPTVSAQVAELEELLGVKLFERLGKRKVLITREGELLREVATPVLDSMERLEAVFRERLTGQASDPLRIVAHPSTLQHLLPNVVQKFRANHKQVPLSILARGRDEIVSLVRNGEADLGITSLEKVPADLEYRVVARFPRILLVPKGSPLAARKKRVGLADLDGERLIVPPKDTHTRQLIDTAFRKAACTYQEAMEINSTEAVARYVASGLGMAIITKYPGTMIRQSAVVSIDVSHLFEPAERGVLFRKGSLSRSGTEFVNLFERGCPKLY